MPKCEVCEKEIAENQGRKYSPRELNVMEPKVTDMKAIGLQSVATAIIMFNNPPDSADKPMWWICQHCADRCFSLSRNRTSLQMERFLFEAVTGKSKKMWWQFWK